MDSTIIFPGQGHMVPGNPDLASVGQLPPRVGAGVGWKLALLKQKAGFLAKRLTGQLHGLPSPGQVGSGHHLCLLAGSAHNDSVPHVVGGGSWLHPYSAQSTLQFSSQHMGWNRCYTRAFFFQD